MIVVIYLILTSEFLAAAEEKIVVGSSIDPLTAVAIFAIIAFVLGNLAMGIYGAVWWNALDSNCTKLFEDQFWWLFLVSKTNTVLLFIMVLTRYTYTNFSPSL